MLLKRNIIKFSPFLMAITMLMSVFLPALPKAMAEEGDFTSVAEQCLSNQAFDEHDNPTRKVLNIGVFFNKNANVARIEGNFSLKEVGATSFFQLDDLEPVFGFKRVGNFTKDITTGDFVWDGNGESVETSEYGTSVVRATYLVTGDLVDGDYEFPISITAISDTGETLAQDESIPVTVNIGDYMYRAAGDFFILSANVHDKTYDGNTVATVTDAIPSDSNFEEGVDYTVKGVFQSVNVGNTYVYVDVENASEALIEKYGGCLKTNAMRATINPKEITADDVTLTPSSFRYSGEANVPEVAVTTSLDGGATVTELRENTDFVLTRPVETVSVGTKTIGFEATGNYTGTFDIDYEVEKGISPNPPEMTAGYIIETGKILADISGERTLGFAWDNPDTVILEGENTYPATYTYNNDTDNYTTIRVSVPVYGDVVGVEYDVLDGDGADYTIGSGVPARFKIGAPRDLFERDVEVFVDGEPIDDNDYIVESGDTTIILSDGFLNGLYAGGHLLRVVFDDGGVATAEFNMLEPEGGDDDPSYVPVPDTGVFGGDNGGAKVIGATMIGVVASVIAFVVLLSKKHYRVKKISFDKK